MLLVQWLFEMDLGKVSTTVALKIRIPGQKELSMPRKCKAVLTFMQSNREIFELEKKLT